MLVSQDTETFLIGPGLLAPPLVCVSESTDAQTSLWKWDDPELVPHLCDQFENHDISGSNFVFDLAVEMRYDNRLIVPIFDALARGSIHCTQMREKLIDLEKGTYYWDEDEEGNFKRKSYSLDACCKRRLGIGKYSSGGDKYRLAFHDFYRAPLSEMPDEAKIYACMDSAVNLRLHEDQDKEHVQSLEDEAHQVRAHFGLHLASARGIRTDNDNVEELRSQCQKWIDELTPELREARLIRKNGKRNSQAAVRRLIRRYTRAGLQESLKLTQTGERILIEDFENNWEAFIKEAEKKGKWISVDAVSCFESGDPVLRRYGVHSKMSNLLSGAVKHLEAGTWLPIQTYFDPLKETGRTSSSGPNIQNVRQGINLPHPYAWTKEGNERLKLHPDPRECFVAREGYVLLACDYSGAENHTLAQCCKTMFGYSKMADALNTGKDLHGWVGATIVGVDYETFMAKLAAKDPECVNARKSAKVANFGFPGGCGAARLVAAAKIFGVFIDEWQAQQLKRDWLIAWPEMVEYFDYVSQQETDDGWYQVDQLFSPRIRGKASFTAACNSYFQGLAADGAKAALFEITRRQWCCPESALYGTYVVNFVHDEFILEVPYRQLEAAARELKQVMCERFNRYTPDVPVDASAEAGVHWKKEMAPVFGLFNANGQPIKGSDDEYGWDESHPLAA